MTDSAQTHMDGPCDICGDIGVSDAIVACSQCRISCEHSYCMRIYQEKLPTAWCCDECVLSNEALSPKTGVNGHLPKAIISNLSVAVHHDTTWSSSPNRNDSRHVCLDWEKKVKTGKVKYLPTQEAIKLSSGVKKVECPSKGLLRSTPGSSKPMTSTVGRIPTKPRAINQKFSSLKVISNHTFGPSGHLKPPGPGNLQVNPLFQKQVVQSSKELKGKNIVLAPTKEHTHKGQLVNFKPVQEIEINNRKLEEATNKALCASSLSIHRARLVTSGGNICHNVERGDSDAETANLMNVLPEVKKTFLIDPALDASWRGRFRFENLGDFSGGVQAHPPSRVRRKVYEFSKKMPEILHFELVPRCNLWSHLFQDDCPEKDDIGLYFFPSNGERSMSYISLLEFIGMQDLVLRNYMDDVELLVLTSRLLHIDSQRWNGNYFLWGVFHRVKKENAMSKDNMAFPLLAHPTNDANNNNGEGNDSKEVDMDIDMIGGVTVGSIDIAIPKESCRRSCGSSKEEHATAITRHMSDVKIPAVSRRLDLTKERPLLDGKKDWCNDIPPGFEGIYRERASDNSCRVMVRNKDGSRSWPGNESCGCLFLCFISEGQGKSKELMMKDS